MEKERQQPRNAPYTILSANQPRLTTNVKNTDSRQPASSKVPRERENRTAPGRSQPARSREGTTGKLRESMSWSELVLQPHILAPICTLVGIVITGLAQMLSGIATNLVDNGSLFAVKQAEFGSQIELQRLEMEQEYLAEALQHKDLTSMQMLSETERGIIQDERKRALALLWNLELLSEGTGRRKAFFERLESDEFSEPLPSIGVSTRGSENNEIHRPMPSRSGEVYPGIAFFCGNHGGTIGCIVTLEDTDVDSVYFALTTRSACGGKGIAVGQPCYDASRTVRIGTVFSWTQETSGIDAALIALDSNLAGASPLNSISNNIVPLDELKQIASQQTLYVSKTGAKSGTTSGIIRPSDIGVPVNISGVEVNGTIRIHPANQDGTYNSRRFSVIGDGGAVAVTSSDKRPIGLIVGSSQYNSYAIPIENVFAALGIDSIASTAPRIVDPTL